MLSLCTQIFKTLIVMKIHSLLLFCSALAIVSCSDKKSVSRMTDDELRTYANELAHKYIITDGHVDLPGALIDKKYFPTAENIDTIIHTGKGNFDYERAVKGGLTAPFMSIYIPSSRQALPDMGKSLADSMINMVHAISQLLPDKFALANTPAQVEANFKQGKISLPMGMENGAPIGNDLANLQHFFDRGIRYITLTHSRDNQICDSSGDTTKTWNGLSPFGKDVVAEMNRLGIMVDISHVDDSTFYQAVKLSKAPVIASHSSCRAFAPTVRRNMTDDMIKKLGEHGGVMQINFYSAFLDSAVSNANTKSRAELKKLLAEKGLQASDTAAQALIAQFEKEHTWKTTPIETVADHIDHVVKIAGIDHVAFGSDYDGVDNRLPIGLEDVSTFPNLIYVLLKRGYTEEDIEKICYKNVWRVWNAVEKVAGRG